jgi:hypothetical protein
VLASKTARRQRERRQRLVSGNRQAVPPHEEWNSPGNVQRPADGLQPYERMFPVEEWS